MAKQVTKKAVVETKFAEVKKQGVSPIPVPEADKSKTEVEALKAERLALAKRSNVLRKGNISKEEDAALSKEWRVLSRRIHELGGKQLRKK